MPALLVSDSAYRFVPPHEGNIWPRMLAGVIPAFLRRKCGLNEIAIRGEEKLKPFLDAGHGLLLAPNHCRMSDALVLQSLSRRLRQPFFVMASSHLFQGSRLLAFLLRRLGAFSVNREGVDRQAVQKAIDILVDAKRPLVIFPEGALSHANDRLNALMTGVSFITRTAAKKRERQSADDNPQKKPKVFVVPVAIRYLFQGDIERTVAPMLARIERRLSWRTQDELPLVERIYRVGSALLALKEIEYLGQPQPGDFEQRLQRLIDQLLGPLEQEWLDGVKNGSVIGRVKELRKAVLPDMIESTLNEQELGRRWRQLQKMELAQQLSLYPAKYVASRPTVDRILETVERFTEHLGDEAVPHPPMKAVVQVGDPIEVAGKRDRSAKDDRVLTELEQSLTTMLEELSTESTLYEPSTSKTTR